MYFTFNLSVLVSETSPPSRFYFALSLCFSSWVFLTQCHYQRTPHVSVFAELAPLPQTGLVPLVQASLP